MFEFYMMHKEKIQITFKYYYVSQKRISLLNWILIIFSLLSNPTLQMGYYWKAEWLIIQQIKKLKIFKIVIT